MVNKDNIIQFFKQDEDKGLSLLYDNYYSSLVSFAISIVEDAKVAEDIVQELFVDFWFCKKYNQVGDGLERYLYQSVKNNCLTWIRNNSRRVNILEKLGKEESPFSSIESEADAFEELYLWINKLPDERRKIFQMVYMEEMSYQEVADALNISKNTVKTQISRSLKFLRDNLKSRASIIAFLIFLRNK